VLFRDEGDTAFTILRKDFPGFAKLKYNPRMKLVYLDPEMVPLLMQYPSALGWLTKSSLRPGIRALALNGIVPSSANLLSGKYRYAIDYGFIYKRLRLDEPSRRFIDFVFSNTGRKILENNGMLPLLRE
jgi:phosphate transport system substrate-binding protein